MHAQTCTSLINSILVAFTNDICVKYSMSSQYYKVVTTYFCEISVWTIIYRLLHAQDPHLGGMICDAQSELATLASNQGEKL